MKKLDKRQTLVISYNHYSTSDLADSIERCASLVVDVFRDESSVDYGESLGSFMKSIKNTDIVVMLISDAYLKSRACMNEVFEAMKSDNWSDHTVFVVMEDARCIYDMKNWANYIQYWDRQYKELDESISNVEKKHTASNIFEELNQIDSIRNNLCRFFESIKDHKNLDEGNASEEIMKMLATTNIKRIGHQNSTKTVNFVSEVSHNVCTKVIKSILYLEYENIDATVDNISKDAGLSVSSVTKAIKQLFITKKIVKNGIGKTTYKLR